MGKARVFPLLIAAALVTACAAVTPPPSDTTNTSLALSGDYYPAHDPVLIREGDRYYSYSTGSRDREPLVARVSDDLHAWRELPAPFGMFDWTREKVEGSQGYWAPDVELVNGRYRIYYSVSRFGTRNSAIGLATSASLDPAAPGYGWRDEGLVVSSSDDDGGDWNAIDPDFQIDAEGRHWLVWGSFWGGIRLVELDRQTGKPLAGAPLHPLARRSREVDGAIEAPFFIRHDGWYYLIVSFDKCCAGVESTYRLAMGRSRNITGPFSDRSGMPMMQGGGTILLEAGAGDRFRGPGHGGYFRDRDGAEYLIHHAYDAQNNGRKTLRIERLGWDADGWPRISESTR